MPVYVRNTNGLWHGPVASGNFRLKWGGGWHNPAAIYCKVGGVGGGYWHDTGYRGYPGTPSTPWVAGWNYDPGQTHIAFSGPSSGAPVMDYHVERLDQNGTPVEGYYQGHGDRLFSTPPDTRHQFRVRSRAHSGLHSPWSGYLRVGIGHKQEPKYEWRHHTEYWVAWNDDGHSGWAWGVKDNLSGVAVPGDVVVFQIYWDLWSNVGVMSPYNSRYVEIIGNEGALVWGGIQWLSNHINGYDYFNHWGNGGRWGFICRGSGWSTDPANNYPKIWGVHAVEGNRHWDSYDHVDWYPAVDNYYW